MSKKRKTPAPKVTAPVAVPEFKPAPPNEVVPGGFPPPENVGTSINSLTGEDMALLPHADSPMLVADSAETLAPTAVIAPPHTLAEAIEHGHTLTEAEHHALKNTWRCDNDGQANDGDTCTTCGSAKKETPDAR